MQGKALAVLLTLLLAAALVGCGGGSGEEQGTASTASDGQKQAPAELEKEIDGAAERVQEERRRGASVKAEESTGDGEPSAPAPSPEAEHHDSGGGAAQFRHEGGDNSIQEFGNEEASAERDRAAAVLHAFLDSRAELQWSDACFYLSADLVASLERFSSQFDDQQKLEGCADILAALNGNASQTVLQEAAKVDVASLRKEGESGFLLYRNAHGEPFAIPVVEEGKTWKVAGLEGSPLS